MTDREVYRELFGNETGIAQLGRRTRGISIPDVALHYPYESGQDE